MREARYLNILPRPRRPREQAVHDRITQAPRHRVRSPFEHDVLEALDALGIAHPLVNHHVDGKERDLYFPAENLVVELDGGRAHRFADDRARDRELFVRTGATTLRFAHGDDPRAAARTVSVALHRLRTLG